MVFVAEVLGAVHKVRHARGWGVGGGQGGGVGGGGGRGGGGGASVTKRIVGVGGTWLTVT